MEMETTSQNRTVLRHLRNGNPLTHRQASQLYGIDRLSARIFDLRNGKDGNPVTGIDKIMISNGRKRFAKYFINAKTETK